MGAEILIKRGIGILPGDGAEVYFSRSSGTSREYAILLSSLGVTERMNHGATIGATTRHPIFPLSKIWPPHSAIASHDLLYGCGVHLPRWPPSVVLSPADKFAQRPRTACFVVHPHRVSKLGGDFGHLIHAGRSFLSSPCSGI